MTSVYSSLLTRLLQPAFVLLQLMLHMASLEEANLSTWLSCIKAFIICLLILG